MNPQRNPKQLWLWLIGLKVHLIFVLALLLGIKCWLIYESQREQIADLELKVQLAKELLIETFGESETDFAFDSAVVTVTSYNAVKAQTDSTPEETASGMPVMPWTCAVSADVLQKYGLKFGDRIILEGLGVFTVADLTNKRFRNRVDLLAPVSSIKWSRKFGVKKTKMYF
jgi:3D (Asp-Asp-Asp) domain-containing protein